ncbi:hypothetical protein [Streptomyces marokkonensis]|uniref:hypothetical protein n=1 Tax=Streptomyces marokkonensis TaxID=324855 RepID=UPI0011F127A9|nr:hypothetical protein [Streptomyces marokkonensis]
MHARFQMLEAFYTAPEAEALFATTQPVMDTADEFAAKLETVADALDTFSVEARPLAERLKQLKADAVAFTDSVEGDDDWTEDEKKVDRNKQLVDDVSATQFAFQDAERRAASRISAVVGGPAFVADDGSGLVKRGTVTYGYDADLFEGAKELPWGSVDDKTYDPWSLDWFGHGAKSVFWDGIYKDGIEAGAKGLWALATGDGEAWSGLKDVVTGIGLYTMTPYDAFMDWAVGPDEESEDEVRAKKAAKEFAKGIVAWDQWEENPARATGTVIFNVLTLGAGPLAAASRAGKGGLASNAAGAASKAGLYMDPLYVGLKATGAAAGKLPKLSDLTSRITAGAGAAADAQRVHSVIELEDGSRVVIENGEFVPYDRHGIVVADAPVRQRSATPETAVVRERELAGVGAMAPTSAATARVGDELLTPVERGGPRATGSAREARVGAGAGHGADPRPGPDSGVPGGGAGPRDLAGVGARAEHGTSSAPLGGEQTPGQTGTEGGGHAAARDSGAGRPAGAGAVERPGSIGGTGERGHAGAGGGDGARGPESDHRPADHESPNTRNADESSAEPGDGPDREHQPDRPDGRPDFTRPELMPGRTRRTLRQMQAMRHGRARFKGIEDFFREMTAGAPERHYPVPTHDHPYYPVGAPKGRNVDVPVDLPDGRTLAIEVKHYQGWRTVTLTDGSTKPVKGEVELNKGLIEQINKDLTLRRLDPKFDPRWVFSHAPPSQALRNYLIQARIIFVEYGPPPK